MPVAIAPDAVDENDETLYVRLSGASGAAIADDEATITISDDDDNHLTIADVALAEGTEAPVQMAFTVQLSSPVLEAAEVQFHTEDITAAAGADYQAVAEYPLDSRRAPRARRWWSISSPTRTSSRRRASAWWSPRRPA